MLRQLQDILKVALLPVRSAAALPPGLCTRGAPPGLPTGLPPGPLPPVMPADFWARWFSDLDPT